MADLHSKILDVLPPGSKLFQFHAFFWKNLATEGLASPPQETPGSATAKVTKMKMNVPRIKQVIQKLTDHIDFVLRTSHTAPSVAVNYKPVPGAALCYPVSYGVVSHHQPQVIPTHHRTGVLQVHWNEKS